MSRPGMRSRREYEVARTPEDVVAFLLDHRNEMLWNPEMVSVTRFGDRPLGVGTRFGDVARALGRTYHLVVEVVEHVPGRRVGMRASSTMLELRTTYTAEPSPAGARVVCEVEGGPRGVWRPLGPVLAALLDRRFDRIYPRAWAVLEGRPPWP